MNGEWEAGVREGYLLIVRLVSRRKVSRSGATVRILTVPLSKLGDLRRISLDELGFENL